MEIHLWYLKRFLYYLFIEVIFEVSCFELEKYIFEVRTIEYM
jgi:hypothetical protein